MRRDRDRYHRVKYHRNVLRERERKRIEYRKRNGMTSARETFDFGGNRIRSKAKRSSIIPAKVNTEQLARKLCKKLQGNLALRMLRAKTIVKWALYEQKVSIKVYKQYFKRLQTHYTSVINRMNDNKESDPIEVLCGKKLHTNYTEPFLWELSYHCYGFNDARKKIAIDSNNQAANIFPGFRSIETKKGGTRYHWKCNDEICKIEHDRIVSVLKPLLTTLSTSTVNASAKTIEKISNKYCQKNRNKQHSLDCYDGTCLSKLLFLKSISPHFPEIRQLVSKISKLLNVAKKLNRISDAFTKCDLDTLKDVETETLNKTKTFLASDDLSSQPILSESNITEKYAAAFKAMELRLRDTPVLSCISCEKLYGKTQVIFLKSLRKPISTEIWNQLVRVNNHYYLFILWGSGQMRTYCKKSNNFNNKERTHTT